MLETNEKDAAYDKLKAKQEGSDKAKNTLVKAGYARGGGVSPKRAVHKHEEHLHKGEPKTKFKQGGKVDGKKSGARADKMSRGGSKPRGHTKININVGSSQADRQQALKTGMVLGAKMGARPAMGAPMQARPPMAPPAGAPAPGGMPPGGPAPMMQKRGGRTYAAGGKVGPKRVPGVPHLTGSAAGGLGRREKMKQYGTKPKA